MPFTPLFGIPMGPELVVIFLILVVLVVPILLLVGLVQWIGNGADEQRVEDLERRVEKLERELELR